MLDNEWISCLEDLKREDIKIIPAIGEFAILWNLFENFMRALVINNVLSLEDEEKSGVDCRLIERVIDDIEFDDCSEKDIDDLYDDFVGYLEKIYKSNIYNIRPRCIYNDFQVDYPYGKFNKILKCENYHDTLLYLYVIVKNVRNNMFHGNESKNILELKHQSDLFDICKRVLAFMLSVIQRKSHVQFSAIQEQGRLVASF